MLYKMNHEAEIPEITIVETPKFTDVLYVRNYGLNNQIFEFTTRRSFSDGRVLDVFEKSYTNLAKCSENSIDDALGFMLARVAPDALKAFITEYEYDGGDSEDEEPETEFTEFCEAVYKYIARRNQL